MPPARLRTSTSPSPSLTILQSKDSYLPYNKPMSIIHWLQNAKPKADVIVILDPDCLLFKPLDMVPYTPTSPPPPPPPPSAAHAAAGGGAGAPHRPKSVF